MDAVNPLPLQALPYEEQQGNHHHQRVQIPVRICGDGGELEARDDHAMEEPVVQVNPELNGGSSKVAPSRTSELTIAFEGEVYVFPAVTPEKVQAVLLLLGGPEIPGHAPSSELVLQQNAGVVADPSRGSKLSRRIASLVRFREKRKERCFEKKIRYSCRKEVAQRMHRKNGQFASLKDNYHMGEGNGDSSDGASLQELRACQHCGISEKSTPAMRRGPAGPRTLCNACGLMWANKGTLRDLSKGGRSILCDQNEPATSSDMKPLAMELENSYHHQDGKGSPEESKPAPLRSNNHGSSDGQNFLEADGTNTDPLPLPVDHSSVNLDAQDLQETLDELANASGSEFEIPANFDEQVVNDSSLGTNWPGT